MATTRKNIEKLLTLLRGKIKPGDLEWLEKAYYTGYKNYKEWIDPYDNLTNVVNKQALIYGVQYLIDAKKQEIGKDHQYTDIPLSYVKELAKILNVPLQKKINKKDAVDLILKSSGNIPS